ncbi:Ribonuclease P protein component [endosymbiont DhMRE of Dentiscutata heterogama]|uniref:ribonuclease P protein component n=1 Tax=endosymbiont DhMRE of Dentiscutata heterogama TaxID=1609546 RepID=UPI000629DD03|nr:ribonuclease P protein component [endosymbiont DhMRE of Dentiscutata heterogama]CFW93122.1 Ribonuclease P protein component [endosymbiont DhMRE of Dentiscutata heterogama]
MLWRPHRLRKNWQFQTIITKGKKLVNPSFVVFFLANNLNNCQFGISTPKKLLKKAVERNRYKRQVREMIISYLKKNQDSCQTNGNHSHNNFVVIIRYPYLDLDFATNQKNLHKLLISASQQKNGYRLENA